MSRKSTITQLSQGIRDHIERRLAEGRLSLSELIAELQATFPDEARTGELPSRSAIHRWGQKLQRRLDAIRASTEAALLIRQHSADREDARSEALTSLVQTELFEAILNLQEASSSSGEGEEKEIDPARRVALLGEAARNIATLSRASVTLKQFQERQRAAIRDELLAEQKQRLATLGQSGEVAPEVLERVIRAAYGLEG